MSTRGIIARPTEDPAKWEGRYHHYDAYPTALGKTLFELCQPGSPLGDGDTDTVLDVLINKHPAGWSTINGVDWSKAPGFNEMGADCLVCDKSKWQHTASYSPTHEFTPGPNYNRPQCYCHGDRQEEGMAPITSEDSDTWCEFAYVIEHRTMTIHEFAYASKTWKVMAKLNLDGPAPDWAAIEARTEG